MANKEHALDDGSVDGGEVGKRRNAALGLRHTFCVCTDYGESYITSQHTRSAVAHIPGENGSCPFANSTRLFGLLLTKVYSGLPRWCSGKEPACQYRRCKRCRFDPWVGKIPWRRAGQPAPVILPGEYHGQRSLAGYCPWGCKEADMAGSDKDACTKDIQVKKNLNSDKERRGKHIKRWCNWEGELMDFPRCSTSALLLARL